MMKHGNLLPILIGGVWLSLAACARPKEITPSSPPNTHAQATHVKSITVKANAANLMGMNVDFPGDYSTTRMFANAIKQSRGWNQVNSDRPVRLDARGWPMEDAALTVWHGIARMNGAYRLSFIGQADVRIQCCSGSIQNLTYNPRSNTTTADLVYPLTGEGGLVLAFLDTKRTASSPIQSGITDVKLMRPKTEGGSDPYDASVLFTTPFKQALKRFQVLRFMDFLATNSNAQENWSDRLTPDWYSMHQEKDGYGWQGRGGAYEYAIQLCNQVGTDCWLTVPAKADDQYVRQLALMIKAQLDPQRKVYIEYSNELWNTAGGFEQSRQNYELAKAEVAANTLPLNFNNSDNDWEWAWRRVAKRGAEISLVFRQVFGDAAMMTRVRPLLMTQLGYPDGPLLQAIHLMQDYYNNPARVTEPKPLNYFFYGLGGSAYYNPKNSSSPDTAFSDLSNQAEWVKVLQQDVDYAAAFGLKRIAYEGGPSFEGETITKANRASYRDDPRIKPSMVQAHNIWSAQGGDLLAYFTIVGESPWGFVPDIWDATHPQKNLKLQAIDILNTQPRAKVTYGIPLPATLDASQHNVPPSWIDGRRSDQLKPGQWFGYTTRVDQANTFKVKLKAASTQANSQVEVWIDGNLLGILSVPKSGLTNRFADTQALTISLNQGLHGIMIRGKTGIVNVNRIVVTHS